jgi:hypothetical protein
MSDTNTDESAFPLATEGGHFSEGMTLRDYFAAKAMQSFLVDVGWNTDPELLDDIASGAYRQADAMLKARDAK